MMRFGQGLIVAVIVGCGANPQPLQPLGNAMQAFDVGQVWAYRTRSSEPVSRIVIGRVESDDKLGQIVHIHVNGLRFKNKHAAGGYSDQIAHMPYSGDALRKCVINVESSTASVPPAFAEGYKEWRSAFDKGEAGIWTLPVDESVSAMEKAINQ